MTTGVIERHGRDLTTLFLVAGLVVCIIGALLAFGVFGSITLLQLGGLICVGLACWFAAVLV